MSSVLFPWKKTLRSKHPFSCLCPRSRPRIKHSSMHTYIMALYKESAPVKHALYTSPPRLIPPKGSPRPPLYPPFLTYIPECREVNLSSIRPMTRHSTNKSFINWSETVYIQAYCKNASQRNGAGMQQDLECVEKTANHENARFLFQKN